MRRSENFALFSLLLTTSLFIIYRSPPVLYIGLIYSMTIALSKNELKEKRNKLDTWTVIGAIMIATAPVFLIINLGEYPSPAIFQSLVLIGASLILFNPKSTTVPNAIAAFGIAMAISVRSGSISTAISLMSNYFVSITSHAVNGVLTRFNVPISMNGNVAVVGNNMVIIGSGCSGFNAFVLYFLASLFLIYLKKPKRKTALLLLLGSVWIIPLNTARILILLLIGYHSGISFLKLFHSHLGDLMFIAYVFAYWWLVIAHSEENRGIHQKEQNIT